MNSAIYDLELLRREASFPRCEWQLVLTSTNDEALLRATQGAVAPLVVLTDEQTAGRGRGNNRWWSAGGGLMFSMLVSTDGSGSAPSASTSLVVGQAICEFLATLRTDHRLRLKWPNDVYLGEKKLGGILIEIPPTRPGHLVVGIGLNINNRMEGAPQEIRERATSLREEWNAEFDLTRLLAGLVPHLVQRMQLPLVEVVHEWGRWCLLSGRVVTVLQHTESITGTCAGIDEDGALVIHNELGRQRIRTGIVDSWE